MHRRELLDVEAAGVHVPQSVPDDMQCVNADAFVDLSTALHVSTRGHRVASIRTCRRWT